MTEDELKEAREPVDGLLYWYRCHNCGWEAWTKDGVRNSAGCEGQSCFNPCLHIHSNRDGELPRSLMMSFSPAK